MALMNSTLPALSAHYLVRLNTLNWRSPGVDNGRLCAWGFCGTVQVMGSARVLGLGYEIRMAPSRGGGRRDRWHCYEHCDELRREVCDKWIQIS